MSKIQNIEELRAKVDCSPESRRTYDQPEFREDLERVVGTQHLGQELRDVLFNRASKGDPVWVTVVGRYIDLVGDLSILTVPPFPRAKRTDFLEALQHVLNVHQVVLSGDRGAGILAVPRNGEEFDVNIELRSDGVIRASVG